MQQTLKFTAGALCAVLILLHADLASAQEGASVIRQMLASVEKLNTIQFTMKKTERMRGSYRESVSEFKVGRKPFRVYLKQSSPNAGAEVLFVKGKYDNKVVVNPNGFPWITLSLDPYATELKKNEHHSIYESGYDYLAGILAHLLDKYSHSLNELIHYKGAVYWEGYSCHHISMQNKFFKWNEYTVGTGETIFFIAGKNKVCPYMILERNTTLKGYSSVKSGQKIMIPGDYALKMDMYIDKQTMLPVKVCVYDDKGLFEEYRYLKLKVNPVFTDSDFSRANSAYGFGE
jgi:outer membrane lipoprotein-sorting protein